MLVTGALGYVLFSGWAWARHAWIVFQGWRQTFPTYYSTSCLIALTVAQMIVMAGVRARARERDRRAAVTRPVGVSEPSVEPRIGAAD